VAFLFRLEKRRRDARRFHQRSNLPYPTGDPVTRSPWVEEPWTWLAFETTMPTKRLSWRLRTWPKEPLAIRPEQRLGHR
jgi:hypothetical protein